MSLGMAKIPAGSRNGRYYSAATWLADDTAIFPPTQALQRAASVHCGVLELLMFRLEVPAPQRGARDAGACPRVQAQPQGCR